MAKADTPTRLLDAAQKLVQRRGFNAFSYKDLAEAVGIRTASIHYHFQTKGELGQALMVRYLDGLKQALHGIDAKGGSNEARLRDFIGLYRATHKQRAICLCGSMATDLDTLPKELRTEVAAYLDHSEGWVSGTIQAGVGAGEFELQAEAATAASTLVAGLQGALILARAQPNAPILDHVEAAFFGGLGLPAAR